MIPFQVKRPKVKELRHEYAITEERMATQTPHLMKMLNPRLLKMPYIA